MHCSEFQSQITDVLSPALGLSELSELKPHIRECAPCREYWIQLRSIEAAYASFTVREPHPHTVYNIIQKAVGHTDSKKPAAFATRFWANVRQAITGWNLAPAMVAMFLMVSSLILVSNSTPPAQVVSGPVAVQIRPVANHGFLERELAEDPPSLARPSDPSDMLALGFKSVAIEDFTALPASPLLNPPVGAEQNLGDVAALSQQFQNRQQALLESDADTLLMRGRRFKTLGRMDLALKDFETVYHFYPNYTYMGDVLMYRAQCYAFLGKFDKAIESLEYFSKRYPSKEPLIAPMIEQLKTSAAEAR